MLYALRLPLPHMRYFSCPVNFYMLIIVTSNESCSFFSRNFAQMLASCILLHSFSFCVAFDFRKGISPLLYRLWIVLRVSIINIHASSLLSCQLTMMCNQSEHFFPYVLSLSAVFIIWSVSRSLSLCRNPICPDINDGLIIVVLFMECSIFSSHNAYNCDEPKHEQNTNYFYLSRFNCYIGLLLFQ